MMNHHMSHPHHPGQFMPPSHYSNAHPMQPPVQRNMINPMEPPYPMNPMNSNQQPPHVPGNGPMPMMHASKCFHGSNVDGF